MKKYNDVGSIKLKGEIESKTKPKWIVKINRYITEDQLKEFSNIIQKFMDGKENVVLATSEDFLITDITTGKIIYPINHKISLFERVKRFLHIH